MATPVELERLVVRLIGDSKTYQKMMKDAIKTANETERAVRKSSINIEKLGDSLNKFGKRLSVFVTTPLIAAGTLALKAASDAEETASKFETVFRDISSNAQRMAKQLDDSYGLSSTGAKQLLADTGDLLTGFGFAQDVALDLSTQVQKLAVDLASFTNIQGGAQRASRSLTKALLGERESIKELGIAILEEDVKKQVAINRSKGLTQATERQEKAFATLQLAVQQSQNAIGDYARTSGSMANQTRELVADLHDLRVVFGNELVPVAQQVISVMKGMLGLLKQLNPELRKTVIIVGALAAALGPLLITLGATIKAINTIGRALKPVLTVIGAIARVITPIRALIVGTITALIFLVRIFLKESAQIQSRVLRIDNDVLNRAKRAGQARPSSTGPSARDSEAAKALQKEIDQLNMSLQSQAVNFGKTARAADIYNLRIKGATDFQLRQIVSADKHITMLEKQREELEKGEAISKRFFAGLERNRKAFEAQGKAITEQVLKPTERYEERLKLLNRHLREGTISQETFNRAAAAAAARPRSPARLEDAISTRGPRAAARQEEFLASLGVGEKARPIEREQVNILKQIDNHVQELIRTGQDPFADFEPANFRQ